MANRAGVREAAVGCPGVGGAGLWPVQMGRPKAQCHLVFERREFQWGGPPGPRLVGYQRHRQREWPARGPAVAVGTAVARCPPHRPVLALLTHTVLTSDIWMSRVKAHVRIRLKDLDWRKQGS